jgi:hypothetical protein
MQYEVLNNWRTSQSAANPSLVLKFPNLQGILRKSGRLARICPSERSKISLLEDNSLETGTGNFIAQNREFIETSREFAASCRELSAGRGKFPGRATTVGRVGVSLHRGRPPVPPSRALLIAELPVSGRARVVREPHSRAGRWHAGPRRHHRRSSHCSTKDSRAIREATSEIADDRPLRCHFPLPSISRRVSPTQKQSGPALGLMPILNQSGESSRVGRISRCGDNIMMRTLLYEAAQVMLTRAMRLCRNRISARL